MNTYSHRGEYGLAFFCLVLMGVIVTSSFSAPQVHADDLQTTIVISICGDGLINSGEVCDDGLGGNTGLYGSTSAQRTCSPGCSAFGPYCGDAVLQVRFDEQCDDGNNTPGDLCSGICRSETPVPPGGGGGSPSVGGTPSTGGTPGSTQSALETKVVLRGKAYPNSDVSVLLDGKSLGTTRADANADFIFSTTRATPGTATFGFVAKDSGGLESITTSVVFEVIQSAITTVSNVFVPPTLKVSKKQIPPGELFVLSGQTAPNATVTAAIFPGTDTILNARAEPSGLWSIQVDTKSLTAGSHTTKASFSLSSTIKSGFGKSVSFFIGNGAAPAGNGPDINQDEKVNLVDFSIFLTLWNGDDERGDFNGDTRVNLADFSIMLFNWTG
jgi:cysteine-rich repeat protein